MDLSHLGLIGNCQISALVQRSGAIVWSAMPRFDSEPVFGALLDPHGGLFGVGAPDGRDGEQRYLPNSNVLETTFSSDEGAFRVVDFAPRLLQDERGNRPTMLVRIVEPIRGRPRISVTCDPVLGWSKTRPRQERGTHHVSFLGYGGELRLTTDAPLSYVDGAPFALTSRKHFVLSWGAPVDEPVATLCDSFLRETVTYWRRWVKRCHLPLLHQEQVIRSALALKLHCFEETGAIVASLTTSIPEAPCSGRTADHRHCRLSDANYLIEAFRLLGHFEERERFLEYLLGVAGRAPGLDLAPAYSVDGGAETAERILGEWAGYEGHGPVRVGNGAALGRPHHVFGEMVLALTPMFIDVRFRSHATPGALDVVTWLSRKAVAVAGQPYAGGWDHRSEQRPETVSSLMCWAAADRMSRIAQRHRPGLESEFQSAAARIRDRLLARATRGARLASDFDGDGADVALLQAITLGLVRHPDPRAFGTIAAVRADLEHEGWLRRRRVDGDFGHPEIACALGTFWCIDALARVGEMTEARSMLGRALATVDAPLGLLADAVSPATRRMSGNYPHGYAHLGLVHAAFAVSRGYLDAPTT